MKAILFLLLASSQCLSHPVVKTWTFHELSHAVEKMSRENTSNNDDVDPDKKPIFDAFNLIMASLFSGEDEYVHAVMLSPSGSKTWTIDELKTALNDTNTNPDLLPFIMQAHHRLIQHNSRGDTEKLDSIQVLVPALDISSWTREDVATALKDPDTKPPIFYHLRRAQQQFDESDEKGEKMETAYLMTPVGLIRQEGVKPTFVPVIKMRDTFTIPSIV